MQFLLNLFLIKILGDRRWNCLLIRHSLTYCYFLFERLIGVFYDCEEMIYFHITRSKLRTMSLRGVFVRKHVQTYRRAEQARSQYSFTRDISCEELRINFFVFGYGNNIFNRLSKKRRLLSIQQQQLYRSFYHNLLFHQVFIIFYFETVWRLI